MIRMPELPEVENFARQLHARYAGAVVERLVFRRNDIRFPLDRLQLSAAMAPGTQLIEVRRVAKQLAFRFESQDVYVSLGMSGHFAPSDWERPLPHEHVSWKFCDHESSLGYVDARRFGFLRLTPPVRAADPLDPAQVVASLTLAKKAGSVKSVRDHLIDQHRVEGVGNIYASEVCFRARVRPTRPVYLLGQETIVRLARELDLLLQEAIELGGSTIATYRNLEGRSGSFQDVHRVYGRSALPCRREGCSGVIRRVVISGRSAFFCPDCQRR